MQPFDGDLDDYQKWSLDVSRSAAKGQPLPDPPKAAAAAPAGIPTANKAPGGGRDDRKQAAQTPSRLADMTRPLRVELQQIDTRIEKLGAERAELESRLTVGKRPAGEIADTGRRLAHIGAEVAKLE